MGLPYTKPCSPPPRLLLKCQGVKYTTILSLASYILAGVQRRQKFKLIQINTLTKRQFNTSHTPHKHTHHTYIHTLYINTHITHTHMAHKAPHTHTTQIFLKPYTRVSHRWNCFTIDLPQTKYKPSSNRPKAKTSDFHYIHNLIFFFLYTWIKKTFFPCCNASFDRSFVQKNRKHIVCVDYVGFNQFSFKLVYRC